LQSIGVGAETVNAAEPIGSLVGMLVRMESIRRVEAAGEFMGESVF
jgi:hypothetical protein